jgi:DNA-binding NarL/FixJ family response regulator
MKKITVILVDDHAVVRAGFRMLLANHPMIDVIAECDRGEAACQLFLEKQPDVMVLDLTMPGIGGLESIRRLCHREPSAKIVVFSVHNEHVYVSRALAAGAKGYITKNSAADILVDAINAVMHGDIYIEAGLCPQQSEANALGTHAQDLIETLTPKEFDIFCLLAKGATTQNIATELCLGYKTVANYATQIKSKLNVATLTELAHIANLLGIVKI